MKIYFAGIIAGHSDFTSWEDTEKNMFEIGLTNRLVSYYFKEITEGVLSLAKTLRRKNK